MAETIEQKIRRMAQLGRERYREVHLREVIDNQARYFWDWSYAFKFFLSRAFFGGRRDEISEVFQIRAFECLDELLGGSSALNYPATTLAALNQLKSEGWLNESARRNTGNLINQQLSARGVNKGTDRLMVIDALALAASLPQSNIVSWAALEIVHGRLGEVDAKLQSVTGVGPMKSSFFLRDMVSACKLEDMVADKDGGRLLPVDTWVRQVTIAIGMASEHATDDEIRQAIVARCRQAGESFIDFNQGAWYIGSHALLKAEGFID